MSKDNRAKLLIRVETTVNSMDQLGDNGGNICPLALLHNGLDMETGECQSQICKNAAEIPTSGNDGRSIARACSISFVV
jgi:hypothetical protein